MIGMKKNIYFLIIAISTIAIGTVAQVPRSTGGSIEFGPYGIIQIGVDGNVNKLVEVDGEYVKEDLSNLNVQEWINKLKDNDEDVREEAAITLGLIGDTSAVMPLIATLKNDDKSIVRENAARALGWLKDQRAVNPLISAIYDKHPFVGRDAIEALVFMGDPRVVESLINVLNSHNSHINLLKADVAKALGKFKDPASIEPLINALNDENEKTRVYATEALGKLYLSRATPTIDPNEKPKVNAVNAMEHLRVLRIIHSIVEILPDWNNGDKILEVLHKLGWKPSSINDTIHILVIKRDWTQLNQMWEITKKVLLYDINSNNPIYIQNAVFAFISIGNESILPDLIKVLNNSGDVKIAESYLNCGNKELSDAAKAWAYRNGYSITSSGGGSFPSWGGR